MIPDLSDMSGGLSNRTYFNFTMYVQWKVIAQHLYTDEAKAAFVRGVGRRIVQEIAPEASAAAKRARASGKLPSVESGEDLPAVRKKREREREFSRRDEPRSDHMHVACSD